MDIKDNPIGFFDSGVGGLSVMRESLQIMPNENYIYFGDSKNAPYGTKTLEEVKKLTWDAVEFLLSKNVKAIVIACNTATSATIEEIRNKYGKVMPIIGIEPAIKPAINLNKKGNIIVMATPMTLREKKFKNLLEKYNNNCLKCVPCAGLVEYIEKGILDGQELEGYLKEKLGDYLNEEISSIVLGCTHYPFIRETLAKIVGNGIDIIDGSHGTSIELKRKLEEFRIKSNKNEKGYIKIYNSNKDTQIIDFCYNLINYKNK